MRLSLIINTCAGDPLAGEPKYGKRSYRQRGELLRDEILPAARLQDWDEILVVGQFEPGEGYKYVMQDPIFRDRRDALWQRELGARSSTGDIMCFNHDDHAWQGDINLLRVPAKWDILVPRRIDKAGGALNNGRLQGYMGGHCLAMRRSLWARVPWTTVDTEWWDITLTRIWREEGGHIEWTDDLTHVDLDG